MHKTYLFAWANSVQYANSSCEGKAIKFLLCVDSFHADLTH